MSSSFLDKAKGCLVGLACGDAVGTTLEFHAPGTFSPITNMIGGGPFDLEAGQWTDDTSMALCLAQSLLYCEGFDPENQMNRYCNWMHYGIPSSTGTAFDIGNTVRQALIDYEATGNPYSGSLDPKTAGNGSLMRLAPVAIYYYPKLDEMIHYAGESSKTTHGAKEAVEACQLFAEYLYNAFSGASKMEILSTNRAKITETRIEAIASKDWKKVDMSTIAGTGYVVRSLEAALWSFFSTSSFEEAILRAANLGNDADTTAAICGQISGAHYGLSGIPDHWKAQLYDFSTIEELAIRLATSHA